MSTGFEYWHLHKGVWLFGKTQPDSAIKQKWYRRLHSPSGEDFWRFYEADGLDNPGTKSCRVEFAELPAELRLTLTLMEK